MTPAIQTGTPAIPKHSNRGNRPQERNYHIRSQQGDGRDMGKLVDLHRCNPFKGYVPPYAVRGGSRGIDTLGDFGRPAVSGAADLRAACGFPCLSCFYPG